MAGTDERMLHSDAFAWYMEADPILRSTVVAIIGMDRLPDWDRLHGRIERLTLLAPKLRQRVQSPPVRIGPPLWINADRFDLDWHLRRQQVADPGSWAQVLEFARIAAMQDFDRSRPLWEFTLLEGLSEGGAALVTKLHHSLTDGIGGLQLAALVLDDGPESPTLELPPTPPASHSPSGIELAARTLGGDAKEAIGAANRMLRSLPGGVMSSVRHPLARVKRVVAGTVSVGRIVAPVNRQLSPLLGDRGTRRLLATLDVPLADLHTAANIGGGHLNDAYIAALAEGMHRYHQRRGAELHKLRVTVPVSVRQSGDAIGGNRITLIRITIPADIASPADRIGQIATIMQRWRHEPALAHTQEIAFGLNMMPRPYIGGILKRIEMLASDVPGLRRPAWLAGAKVNGYYGFGPTIGSSVNATLMSYAETCNIGINIDTDAIDDPPALLDCLREAFDEMVGIANPVPPSPSRQPRKPARRRVVTATQR
jgi:diacylglycerol O-acyltransferase